MRRLVAAVLAAGVVLTPGPVLARTKERPDPTLPTKRQVERALGADAPTAALIYDPARDRVLWHRRGEQQRPVASLMKIATALVISERLQPIDEVVISGRAASAPHDQLQWRRGARFTVDDVMHGMLMPSSNGAAIALAERTAGSVERFRTVANRRMKQWGIADTRLVDPSGLEATGQYSTARDIARLSARLLGDPWLATIVRTRERNVAWPDGGEATFVNLNRYLAVDDTAIGVKNGFTSSAGNVVAAAATRGGRTHVVVVLDAPDVYGVAQRLMDLAFTIAPPPQGLEGFTEPLPEPIASASATPEATTETRVLGMTAVRDEPAEEDIDVPVAAAVPPLDGPGTLMRMALAAPIAAWGTRILQVDRARARRRRRMQRVRARAR